MVIAGKQATESTSRTALAGSQSRGVLRGELVSMGRKKDKNAKVNNSDKETQIVARGAALMKQGWLPHLLSKEDFEVAEVHIFLKRKKS